MTRLATVAGALRDDCDGLVPFEPPVAHVYNPLRYAWDVHQRFLDTVAGDGEPREVLLVGMNPGPWGMGQTGVPFGDPHIVREWMGVHGEVGQPVEAQRHPKRAVEGFASARREVSGTRLYSMARDHFGGVAAFFKRFHVTNYCPLLLFDGDGKNLTPPRLRKADRERLFEVCDGHLRAVARALRPRVVVGVGRFAERRAEAALDGEGVDVGGILHPSPASPKANQGWVEQALAGLAALGVRP